MLDDMDQYPPFSPYTLNFNGFDALEMKRAQESIGGPETVKKARQYPPGYETQANASFYNPAANSNGAGTIQSPPSLYSNQGQNGSIVAPPMLNPMGMTLNGLNMNGMGGMGGMSGMNGMHTLQQQMGQQSSPLMGYNGMNGMNASPQSMGMMMPPSPNPAMGQQTMLAQQQQQQQQQQNGVNGQSTPSPNTQAAFLQQQQQAMMGMNNQAMGMVPGMFGGMPMGMPFGFPQMAFQQNQMMNPVQAAAAAAANNATGRTVYIGNLPADASVDELLNLVRFGPIESVRVLPERSCVFISFLDGATAASFHADATVKKLTLHGQELKIGWGKPSPVPSQVLLSIQQSNASRNVYLGGLDPEMTEEMLRDDLGRFGLIDQVKIVRDKNIGFVHFLSISTATKVVATLPTEPAWAGKRVNYGKDRCAYVPKSQQPQTAAAAHAQAVVQQAGLSPIGMNFAPFSPLTGSFPYGASPTGTIGADGSTPTSLAFGQAANRTVYIGNIHPETSIEEMCNTIRGGALQSIRYLADKHIAFVTFIDPAAAFTFHSSATFSGLTLNNRRLKIGWGKHSGPLSPSLALSIQSGATRNVYVGNIEDFEKFSIEKLKRDFGEYGDVELVNFLKEKNCAFVNYTNISNAVKAIDGIKNKPEYTNLRIAHGKDRCANPPRPVAGNRRVAAAVGPNAGGVSPGPELLSPGPELDGEDDVDVTAE